MRDRSRLTIYLTLLSLSAAAASAEPGSFSRAATSIWGAVAGSPSGTIVQSPDHESRAVARWKDRGCNDKDECVVLDVDGAIGNLHIDVGPGVGSEILWAPDSKALFVTTSNGGASGDYHLFVIDRFNGRLGSRDLTKAIYKAFGQPFRCDAPEGPNVAGIGWVKDTHDLWVAAEVYPHSNCDSFGTFKAYKVHPATQTVMKTLDQLEAKRELGSMLGTELRDAPDGCIRNPKSCYVSTNHREIHTR